MGRILDSIASNSKCTIPDYERALLRLGALLHDVGHYPFSHVFEGALQQLSSLPGLPLRHEQVTWIIVEEDPELKEIFSEEAINTRDLLSIMRGEIPAYILTGLDSDCRRQFMRMHGADSLDGKHIENIRHLHLLISSDLDCDRLDYLTRAAAHGGASYGAVEIDYLIDNWTLTDRKLPALNQRAAAAADHFLTSRFYEYRQTYYHQRVAAHEVLLQAVIQSALRARLLPELNDITKCIADGHWCQFDDVYLLNALRKLGYQEPLGMTQRDRVAEGKSASVVDFSLGRPSPQRPRDRLSNDQAADLPTARALAADFFAFRQPSKLLEFELILHGRDVDFFQALRCLIRTELVNWQKKITEDLSLSSQWTTWLLWERSLPIADVGGADAVEAAQRLLEVQPSNLADWEKFSEKPAALKLVRIAQASQGRLVGFPLICMRNTLLNSLRSHSYCCVRVFGPHEISGHAIAINQKIKTLLAEAIDRLYQNKNDELAEWLKKFATEECAAI